MIKEIKQSSESNKSRFRQMSKPTEHKSVQARILKYAEEIGWSVVSRSEAEERREFDASGNKI